MTNPLADFKNTKVFGNIGHPIFPSYSAIIHNAAFKILSMNDIYVPFDVHPQQIDSALRGILALGIAGVNVLSPHSETVIKHLDEVSGEASMLGLVNMVVNEGERLLGYNTNIAGITESLKLYKDDISEQQISILGAGNMAKTVAYTVVKHFRPKTILIVNRDQQKADKLRKYIREEINFSDVKVFPLIWEETIPRNSKSKLIVNATPIGMHPKEDEMLTDSDQMFHKNQLVLDVVFNPGQTKFLTIAKSKGAITISGLEILLNQSAKSFELWTNKTMPLEEIRKIVIDLQNHKE